MTSQPRYLFIVCQKGAEGVCKAEVLANHREFKLSFSRPGFVTFKCEDESVPEKLTLKTSFARTYGWSVGSFKVTDARSQITELCENEWLVKADHLHVFERDTDLPGSRGFEPGATVLANEVGQQVVANLEGSGITKPLNRSAKPDELVFDIAMVDPDQWFVGYHYAQTKFQRWPGGVPKIDTSTEVVSRAYYKLLEAMLWSGIQINAGDCCAEIGASPGGGCQLMLEKEAKVIAVDPAEMQPEIVAHPNLTYIRGRGREIRKKDLKDVRWLVCDINAVPNFTLDAVADIVTNQNCQRIRGIILTMKITDWKLAQGIEEWKKRVREFGFQVVKTRQLAFSRKEICLVGIRDKYALRASRKKESR